MDLQKRSFSIIVFSKKTEESQKIIIKSLVEIRSKFWYIKAVTHYCMICIVVLWFASPLAPLRLYKERIIHSLIRIWRFLLFSLLIKLQSWERFEAANTLSLWYLQQLCCFLFMFLLLGTSLNPRFINASSLFYFLFALRLVQTTMTWVLANHIWSLRLSVFCWF